MPQYRVFVWIARFERSPQNHATCLQGKSQELFLGYVLTEHLSGGSMRRVEGVENAGNVIQMPYIHHPNFPNFLV